MVTVAIDEGPLHGVRTGIGNAVEWVTEALRASERDLELRPYVTSMRARVRPPTRRLPVPAVVAHQWWARGARPTVDRWLGRPDVVHGTNYVVPPTRCPRLVSVYDCWFLEHPEQASPAVARAGAVLRRSVADGAHVVTSSDSTTQKVRVLLDTDHVTTVHLGPPPALEPLTTGDAAPGRLRGVSDSPFVLSLGTMERRKNIPALVAAFARLAGEHPTVRLVLAGSPGDDTAAVDSAIEMLPRAVGARVLRLGRVDHAERHWLMESATVVAYPSLDEGFGFPVLEAQAAGTPVVASSAGSIPEVAGTAALYSAADDVDALAANLHWVVTSERQATALVEKGRRNVERFSWTSTADAYIDLYEQLAATE